MSGWTAEVVSVAGWGYRWNVYRDSELMFTSGVKPSERYVDTEQQAAADAQAAAGGAWPGTYTLVEGFTISAGELEPWHYVGSDGEPGFESDWVNTGVPNLGFRIRAAGIVDMLGVIGDGSSATIFTLPAGYRPPNNDTFINAVGETLPGEFTPAMLHPVIVSIATTGIVEVSGSSDVVYIQGQFFLDPPGTAP